MSKTTFRTKVKDIFKIPQINKVTKTEKLIIFTNKIKMGEFRVNESA